MTNYREKSKGYATVLILGGVSEAMDHGRGDIRLTMNKRRGFVKYAMQVRVTYIQGDTLRCSIGSVDMKTKDAFLYKLLILK